MQEQIQQLSNQRELHKSQGSRDLNTLGMRDEHSQIQSNQNPTLIMDNNPLVQLDTFEIGGPTI